MSKYEKTDKKAIIVQHIGNRNDKIERRIYKNEYGREFVIVNRCFINLDHYENDRHFDVCSYIC